MRSTVQIDAAPCFLVCAPCSKVAAIRNTAETEAANPPRST
jgi:hypothetical protein